VFKQILKMAGGVTNGYIHNVLKREIRLSKRFIDVYAADTIDVKRLRRCKKFIFISNLAATGELGTHFVCVIGTPNSLIYLDSYAQPPTLSHLLYTKLKQLNRRIVTRYTFPIQHVTSEFCGMYCIFNACLYDDMRMKNVQGMRSFSKKHLLKNDKTVMYNIKQLLKLNPR
jgi:hypothetical protein